MSAVIDKLTAWFKAQVGTKESGENNVIYNTHYYGRPTYSSSFPWCVTFIWDGFRESGLSDLFCNGEKTAYCPYVMDWAQRHDQWVTDGYQEGDLLLYDQDGDGQADHIGYCIEPIYLGSYVCAVEGDYSNSVAIVQRAWHSILGAYRPKYPAESSGAESAPGVDSSGLYTVQPGDTLWGLADRFLGDGLRFSEIMEKNGLVSSIILPGQELQIPGARTPEPSVTVSLTLKERTLQTLRDQAAGRPIGEYLDTLFA